HGASGTVVFQKEAAAINRAVNLGAVGRTDQFVGRGGRLEIGDARERIRIEPLNLVGTLGGKNQRAPAGAIVGVQGHWLQWFPSPSRGGALRSRASRTMRPPILRDAAFRPLLRMRRRQAANYPAPFSRSSASAIFALRPSASSRLSFSSSTTSSGARATKLAFASLAST